MQQHKMHRRMIVILHIKIHRQVIKRITAVHCYIIPKLPGSDPDRLLIDIRLIR